MRPPNVIQRVKVSCQDADRKLLDRCREGDPNAFGAFYLRHREVLLASLVRRVRNPETAADLLAETFASALVVVRDSSRPLPDVPAAWLFTIARNLMIDSVRSNKIAEAARQRLGMARLDLDDADLQRIEDVAASVDLVSEMESRIPAADWQAFRARFLEDETYEEMALRLGCSEAVARKRVSRARSNLRVLLGAKNARLP